MDYDMRFTASPRPGVCTHGVIGDCEQCTSIDDAAERNGRQYGQLLKAKLLAKVAKIEAEKEMQAAIEKHRLAREVDIAADDALQSWLKRSGATE